MIRAICLALCTLCAVGCQPLTPVPSLITNSPPPAEVPVANIPTSLRPYNWIDARGSGSCVNASTCYLLIHRNLEPLAKWWRANHAGGETDSSIRRHLDAAGLPYAFTRSADSSFLDWCTRTRRGAIIWFYDRHCVAFCGFHQGDDGKVYAFLNDNNRPTQFIRVERAEFLRRWRGYGGFGLTLLNSPIPPPLWPRFQEQVAG